MSETCVILECASVPNGVIADTFIYGLPFIVLYPVVLSIFNEKWVAWDVANIPAAVVHFLRSGREAQKSQAQQVDTESDSFAPPPVVNSFMFDFLLFTIYALISIQLILGVAWAVIIGWSYSRYYSDWSVPALIALSVFFVEAMVTTGLYTFMFWKNKGFRWSGFVTSSFIVHFMLLFIPYWIYLAAAILPERAIFIQYLAVNFCFVTIFVYNFCFEGSMFDYKTLDEILTQKVLVSNVNLTYSTSIIQTRRRSHWYLLISWVVLIIMCVHITIRSSSSFAVANAVALFILDLFVLYHQWAGLVTDPALLTALNFAIRGFMYAFGIQMWFIALCFNFLILSWLVSYHVVSSISPLLDTDKGLKELADRLDELVYAKKCSSDLTNLSATVSEDVSNLVILTSRLGITVGQNFASTKAFKTLTILLNPVTGLVLLYVSFLFATLGAYLARGDLKEITLIDDPHPQWQFGLGFFLLSIFSLFTIFAVLKLRDVQFTLKYPRDKSVMLIIGAYCSLSVASGLVFAAITRSWYILGIICFLPTAVLSFALCMGRWKMLEFDVKRDPTVWVTASICVLLLLGLAVVLSADGGFSDPSGSSILPSAVAAAMLFVALIWKWFAVFALSRTLVVFLVCTLVVGVFSLCWAGLDVAFSIILVLAFPATICLLVMLRTWKLFGFKFNKQVLVSFICSSALTLGLAIGLAISFPSAVLRGLVACGYMVLLGVVFALMKWASNDFYLPMSWRIAGGILAFTAFVVAVVIFIFSNMSAFAVVSALTLTLVFILVLYIAFSFRQTTHSRLQSSKYILPLFRFKPTLTTDGFKVAYGGVIASVLLFLIVEIWGFAASMVHSPVWIGFMTICLGVMFSLWVICDAIYRSGQRFWQAWSDVSGVPGLVEQFVQHANGVMLRNEDHEMLVTKSDEEPSRSMASEEDSIKTLVSRTIEREEEKKVIADDEKSEHSRKPEVVKEDLIMTKFANRKIENKARNLENLAIVKFTLEVVSSQKTVLKLKKSRLHSLLKSKFGANVYKMNRKDFWKWMTDNQERFNDEVLISFVRDHIDSGENLEDIDLWNEQQAKRKLSAFNSVKIVEGESLEDVRSRAAKELQLMLASFDDNVVFEDETFSIDPILQQLDQADVKEHPNFENATSSLHSDFVSEEKAEIVEVVKQIVDPTNVDFRSVGSKLLFEGEIDPHVIVQGLFEDCYLLSSVNVMAKYPGLIKRLFVTSEANARGIYAMCFYLQGKWRAVFIDDRFPVLKDSGELICARSLNENELWVSILEKCYASVFGGYQNIEGGLVNECLIQLTGGYSEQIKVENKSMEVYNGALWLKLEEYFREGYLMGCGTYNRDRSGKYKIVRGLVPGHAYGILDLREVDGVRLLKLKNPWGHFVWTGDWSNKSELWNHRFRSIVGTADESKGEFFIAFGDFCTYFRKIYVCRVFEVDDSSKSWMKIEQHGAWDMESNTAQGCPMFIKGNVPNSPELNPQYFLTVSRPAVVFFSLRQHVEEAQPNVKMALFVLSNGGNRARTFKRKEIVSSSGAFSNFFEASCEAKLLPGVTYTIFLSTYQPGEEAEFSLAAFCRHPFTLTPAS